MPNTHFGRALNLLFTRRFGTFWFASLLANIGTWAQQVAQPWLLLSLGASPFLLGLDSFASGAPVLLLTLIGGALADRADRRRVIAGFQSVQMLCPILLLALLLTGHVQPWMVITMSLIVGITDALSMPSFQSIVPSIVAREQIPSGIALNTTQFNLSRILGPAIAGLLMTSVGLAGAYAVSAASYLPFILVALWVLPRHVPQPELDQATHQLQLIRSVKEVWAQPRLRGALLTVFLTSVLCGPIVTFCPVLIKDVFQGDAARFSLTLGAFGLGGLLGATLLLGVDPERDRRPLSSWSAAAYGLIVILAALNRWAWALPLLFLMAGIAMTSSNASANALLQSTAPTRIRGQTVSLFMLAMRGGMALGGLATGASVNLIGVRHALLLNGLLALAAQLWLGRAWRRAV
ncbi:MAG: MFS transporter [Aquabacterium sp.]|uniref:MFS transporter n=1 Tax=Aquabacterium sp. TaxID=1872578 RepID=UPI001204BEDD|nr:MFS transporter [Aquabacterium sp.]TAK86586.1 MAG: MFS transporter [Aquabacterium sp.]